MIFWQFWVVALVRFHGYDGLVYFKMESLEKPQIICHTEKSLNYCVYDARWVPVSAKFVVLGSKPRGTGIIKIFEICQGQLEEITQVEKPKALKCGTFGASNVTSRCLATGDFEGKVQVWDLENLGHPVYSAAGHADLVNCIDGVGGMCVGSGAPEIATGGRDGVVNIWDTRQKEKPVAVIAPEEGETRRDCWCVAFGNSFNSEDRMVAAGYDNGDLKLFDLKAMRVHYETNLKNGVCGVEFDRKDIQMNKLVATTLESKFYLFDLRVCNSKKGYPSLKEKAHKSTIWSVRHLPQNREIFATTGGDGSVSLWRYQYPEKRVVDGVGVIGKVEKLQNIELSTQPVSTWDWSPDKLGLAVCTSFDQTVRVIIVTKLNQF